MLFFEFVLNWSFYIYLLCKMVMTNTSHFFAWLSIGHKTCILFKNCSSPCGTDHKIFDNLLFLKCIFSLYDYFKRSFPSKSDFKEVLIVDNHEKYSYKWEVDNHIKNLVALAPVLGAIPRSGLILRESGTSFHPWLYSVSSQWRPDHFRLSTKIVLKRTDYFKL